LCIGNYYCIPEVLSFFRVHDNQGTAQSVNDFNVYIEDYTYIKSIQLTNQFNVQTYSKELNHTLKKRVFNVIDKVPRMILKKRFDLIKVAFRFAYYEKILLKSIIKLLVVTFNSTCRKVGFRLKYLFSKLINS
jgi:hypothetical protein